MIGYVVFDDNVRGELTGISLSKGMVFFRAEVGGPRSPFNVNSYRIYAPDDSLVFSHTGESVVPSPPLSSPSFHAMINCPLVLNQTCLDDYIIENLIAQVQPASISDVG